MLQRHHRHRGFTLIEMVVVIGIILIIIGALLPALVSAWRNARRTRSAHDLQVISGALEEYRKDFSDYPRIDYVNDANNMANMSPPTAMVDPPLNPGAVVLCWALIAPADSGYDGADGPGFRLRGKQGRVYLPYLNPEQFKLSVPAPSTGPPQEVLPMILDPNGHPYLYFPAYKGSSPTTLYVADIIPPTPPATTPQQPYFNLRDNREAFYRAPLDMNSYTTALNRLEVMLGDRPNPAFDGIINNGEVAKWTGPYLLWGAGPDEQYGPLNPNDLNQVTNCDDVSNVP